MKIKSILAVMIILAAITTLSNNVFAQDMTPYMVRAYNQTCNTIVSQATVTGSYNYQGVNTPINGTTDNDGVFGGTCPVGATIYIHISKDGHYGENCGIIQTEIGVSFTVCLNDVSCCVPKEYQDFCLLIR